MTASTIALTELAEKGADVDVLRQMVQFMAQRLMEIEACIKGSSTRSVDDLVKAIGMSGVSKSPVSRLCGELDEQVGAFLNRTLD
jgi:transposase-like protein